MPERMPVFQRIAVAAHPKLPDAEEEAARVTSYVEDRGLHVVSGLIFDEDLQYRIEPQVWTRTSTDVH